MPPVTPRSPTDSTLNTVIAGRYQLLERISQGGAGEVFAARDSSTGRKVALKRALPGTGHRSALFQAEYHALARLRHPYIIQVYDYGVDAEHALPYYTMELLDGQDLLETRPADYRECCRLLRDVATSLSLLHAHRMLHRDVSPRNVRKTSTGRCKLFDFGAMVPFGVPPNLTGTPPFVSPEAWEGSVLDQRSDLYSLGALAYWLITRKLPYEAKAVIQHGFSGVSLPARMRKSVPEVPEALDDLVMSLLEFDPVKRPSTAAEVIVRFNQIGGLEPDDSVELAQSYLSSARFVGRRKELAALDHALGQCAEQHGGSIFISGPAGSGRTRLLQEVALMAQTRGVRVVRAFGAGGSAGGELAREIYQGLRRAAPEAFKLLDFRDQAIVRQLDREARNAQTPHIPNAEGRSKLHAALRAYAHVATAEGSWVILIDDIDAADPFSTAFVTSLAREAKSRALLVIATGEAHDLHESEVDGSLTLFGRDAASIRVEPLELDATRALCASLFGSVPHLERLVVWLYRQAHGNPALTMELAALLLRRGVIRYVEGAFLLPSEDIDEAVPQDLSNTLLLKLDQVSKNARKIAALVATCRGSAPLELCLAAGEMGPEETLVALEDLVRHGVLMTVREDYAFPQEAMRRAVRATLDASQEKEIHRRLARALLSLPTQELEQRLEAGWHLVHTEDERAGADLLAEVTPPLIESGMAYGSAIAAAEKALHVYERDQVPLHKRLALSTVLVRAGFLYDYKLALRYGETTISALESWMQLPAFRKLGRLIGGIPALALLFAFTSLRWFFTFGKSRGPSAYASLQYLSRSLVSLLGVRTLGLDARGAKELYDRIAFLRSAPPLTSGRHVYLLCHAVSMQPLGREPEVREATGRALHCLAKYKVRDMSETERTDMRTGLLLSRAINECYRAGSESLTMADTLESIGTHLARAAAQRVRLTYHMVRGGRDEADRHRRMLDVHAIEGGTTWQVEWFAVPVEGLASARMGDLVSARRALERLEELSNEVPTLAPLRDVLRILYQARRGNLELAMHYGAEFVSKHPPRAFIGWVAGYSAYANALNESGRYEQALKLCERAIRHISDADREYAGVYSSLDRELCFAYAAMGEHEKADRVSARQLELFEKHREHCWLYSEHENIARVCLVRRDHEGVRRALSAMRESAQRSNSQFLLAQSTRTSATYLRSITPSGHAPGAAFEADPDSMRTPIDGPKGEAHTPVRGLSRSRARNVLRRAMDESGARAAHLFVLGPTSAYLTASADEHEPPSGLSLEAWSLGSNEANAATEPALSLGTRIRTVNIGEEAYDLMLLPRRSRHAKPSVLALGHDQGGTVDLHPSVLEKLAAWSFD